MLPRLAVDELNGGGVGDALATAVHPGDAEDEWWCPGAEDAAHVEERVNELFGQIMLMKHASCVVVTHSNFVRHVFRCEGHDDIGQLGKDCATRKLNNCAVVALKIDFNMPQGSRIVDSKLLFGSQLASEHQSFNIIAKKDSLLAAIRRMSSEGSPVTSATSPVARPGPNTPPPPKVQTSLSDGALAPESDAPPPDADAAEVAAAPTLGESQNTREPATDDSPRPADAPTPPGANHDAY